MNLIATLKARTAAQKLAKGDTEAAKKQYEEAIAGGLNDPRYLLSYSVLLIRDGEYQKAREFLVKLQNNRALSGESKKQLYVNYAACVYKLGDLPKAIAVLEGQHGDGIASEPVRISASIIMFVMVTYDFGNVASRIQRS